MLDLIFIFLVGLVFGRLAIFAIRATWGIAKFLVGIIFLPLIIIFAFIKGLVYLAWPLLIIAGLYSLFFDKKIN